MSSTESQQLQCYNKGCLQLFSAGENGPSSCTHHPGEPVFHDAYKGWSCCNKKCTDFTEFLNIKGCTVSTHNPEKPPEVIKQKMDNVEEVITYIPKNITNVVSLSRPSVDSPLARLPMTIAPSLTKALEAQESKENVATEQTEGETAVQVGTSCKNSGCKEVYENENSNNVICRHHPGTPIFHEGMKYWSCCNKKTTDFSSFLDQLGCEEGNHVWVAKKDSQKLVDCRYDWHQTGSHVYVAYYAKACQPAETFVEANPVKLRINIVFNQNVFKMDVILKGIITVEESSVTVSATKVEIKLKKAEAVSWDKLEMPLQDSLVDGVADVDIE